MGQTLYLECTSGISGDMTAAALVDLGADRSVLDQVFASLPVHGFEVEIGRVKKSGLDVCDFHVKLDEEHENHDHDMEYLYGHLHGGNHGCGEGHGHGQEGNACEGSHSHDTHPHGHHEHRGLPEILEIIDRTEMSGRAKETASRIFRILAQAEAKAHGAPLEQVHFHEVGAVDSIVDIIAVAVCLDNLDITEVIVPYVCEGSGTVRCQHGILPVPVPAVVNVAEAHGIPLRMTGMEGELVTPTGAAIVAAIRTAAELPKAFAVKKTGIGAGKRNYERPSLLRAMLVESAEKSVEVEKESTDTICKLETNIDDCTGETLGYVMSRLLEFGARDVYYTPVYMKKNRPAYQLSVICDEFCREELEQIIFRETTTIGIRRVRMERTVLKREIERVTLSFGELKIKKCILPDGREKRYPEYESAVELAEENGMSLQQVLDEWKRHG